MTPRDADVLCDLIEDLEDLLNGPPGAPGFLDEFHDDDLTDLVDDVVGAALDRLRRHLTRHRDRPEEALPLETP